MWSSAPDRVSGSDQWCEATTSRSLLVSGSTSRMDVSCTAILAARCVSETIQRQDIAPSYMVAPSGQHPLPTVRASMRRPRRDSYDTPKLVLRCGNYCSATPCDHMPTKHTWSDNPSLSATAPVQVFGRRHDELSTPCGDRRPKSAKARSRGKFAPGGATSTMRVACRRRSRW